VHSVCALSAKLEKFTWMRSKGNNMLWTSIFSFSFFFLLMPLVLPVFFCFCFPFFLRFLPFCLSSPSSRYSLFFFCFFLFASLSTGFPVFLSLLPCLSRFLLLPLLCSSSVLFLPSPYSLSSLAFYPRSHFFFSLVPLFFSPPLCSVSPLAFIARGCKHFP